MSEARRTELLESIGAPVTIPYDENDVLPTTGLNGVGLNILNQDTANELVLTLTLIDASTLAIPVPAGTAWSDIVPDFIGIIKSGSSTTYKIQVKEK